MRIFKITCETLEKALNPDIKLIIDAILENNDSFEFSKDPVTKDIIIRCKNKPRDLPIHGIYFKEFKKCLA